LLLLFIPSAPSAARADEPAEKAACIAEHAHAQRARNDGKLQAARIAAIACAQATCPSPIRAECTQMLASLELALPTLVVEARTPETGPILDVTLDVDGVRLAGRLDGKAIALDPGEHLVRVGTSDGRSAEQRIVLLEGEARRRVVLDLGPGEAARAAAAVSKTTPREERAQAAGAGPRPVPASPSHSPSRSWAPVAVFGGGLAALGVFGVFGLRGYREQIRLESTCAPACAPGADDAMRRDYLVADVALAASVVALAAASWLYVTSRPSGAPPTVAAAR
jgi:hypothetical protein